MPERLSIALSAAFYMVASQIEFEEEILCDSYKGCLSSREVNEAIASGVKEWNAASSEIIT